MRFCGGIGRQKLLGALFGLSAVALLGGCAGSSTTAQGGRLPIDRFPLGSNENPIRCDKVEGEHSYLQRLRCSEGEHAPYYRRIGNVGPGPYGTNVNQYLVSCSSQIFEVYFDPNHSGHVEQKSIANFKLTEAK